MGTQIVSDHAEQLLDSRGDSVGGRRQNVRGIESGKTGAADKTISFLNFLDSIQGENLPNINEYVTAPEVCSLLNIQAFQEEIHAQSYSYILDSVCSPETRENIYDEWRNDPRLLERNRFIADLYQQFVDDRNDKNFVRTCMANFLLESLYFYSGFSFFYALARNGKMTATATIIKYIQRDELTHVVLFQNMIKELRKENPDLFTSELIEELREMTRTAVQHEIRWGQYITNNHIQGLNNDLIDRYIKFLANERLGRLGLEILYPEITSHPMKYHKILDRLKHVGPIAGKQLRTGQVGLDGQVITDRDLIDGRVSGIAHAGGAG